MKKLIHYALNQPLFIVLGTLLFVMAGITAFKNLSVEAFPDVTDTQVTVIALYPGRAAEEVEKQVTLPLEANLSGLPHSIRVFSHTQFGLSFTVITFDDQADVNLARQQVYERLSSVDLPDGAQVNVAPNATPVGEIMRYRVRGDGLSTTDLRTLEDWTIERSLRQVPGVADVVAMGGFIKQYEVQPDLDKLRAYKLTFQNLLDALGRGNSNAGGSYVAQGAQQFAIRGIGLLRSPEEIGQIIMPSVEYGYGDCIRPFGLGVPMILCGLDTVVTGNCDDLARYCLEADVMALPRDPYKPKIACTGVCLVPHGYAHVFATWHGQNDMDHMRAQEHVFIDSVFPGQVQSYKGHVERRGLGDTRICYFHGLKKPHELKLDWINKHWKGE